MEKKRAKLLEMRSFARGIIGGGWELLNEEGKLERSTDLAGNYVLLYFGNWYFIYYNFCFQPKTHKF